MLGLHIVVMIVGIHISQQVFVSDMLTASLKPLLKPSLEHDGKHVLDCYNCTYGDQLKFSCIDGRQEVRKSLT